MIGTFSCSSLLKKVRQVEKASNVRCPRAFRRAEALLVKWVYQHRALFINSAPLAAGNAEAAAPPPMAEIPTEYDFLPCDGFDFEDHSRWD
jgi:hypothetical protein